MASSSDEDIHVEEVSDEDEHHEDVVQQGVTKLPPAHASSSSGVNAADDENGKRRRRVHRTGTTKPSGTSARAGAVLAAQARSNTFSTSGNQYVSLPSSSSNDAQLKPASRRMVSAPARGTRVKQRPVLEDDGNEEEEEEEDYDEDDDDDASSVDSAERKRRQVFAAGEQVRSEKVTKHSTDKRKHKPHGRPRGKSKERMKRKTRVSMFDMLKERMQKKKKEQQETQRYSSSSESDGDDDEVEEEEEEKEEEEEEEEEEDDDDDDDDEVEKKEKDRGSSEHVTVDSDEDNADTNVDNDDDGVADVVVVEPKRAIGATNDAGQNSGVELASASASATSPLVPRLEAQSSGVGLKEIEDVYGRDADGGRGGADNTTSSDKQPQQERQVEARSPTVRDKQKPSKRARRVDDKSKKLSRQPSTASSGSRGKRSGRSASPTKRNNKRDGGDDKSVGGRSRGSRARSRGGRSSRHDDEDQSSAGTRDNVADAADIQPDEPVRKAGGVSGGDRTPPIPVQGRKESLEAYEKRMQVWHREVRRLERKRQKDADEAARKLLGLDAFSNDGTKPSEDALVPHTAGPSSSVASLTLENLKKHTAREKKKKIDQLRKEQEKKYEKEAGKIRAKSHRQDLKISEAERREKWDLRRKARIQKELAAKEKRKAAKDPQEEEARKEAKRQRRKERKRKKRKRRARERARRGGVTDIDALETSSSSSEEERKIDRALEEEALCSSFCPDGKCTLGGCARLLIYWCAASAWSAVVEVVVVVMMLEVFSEEEDGVAYGAALAVFLVLACWYITCKQANVHPLHVCMDESIGGGVQRDALMAYFLFIAGVAGAAMGPFVGAKFFYAADNKDAEGDPEEADRLRRFGLSLLIVTPIIWPIIFLGLLIAPLWASG